MSPESKESGGDIVFDPSAAPCLEEWQRFADNSPCLYAAAAEVWGTPDWSEQLTMEENIEAMLPYFFEYVEQEGYGDENIDGFVVKPDRISFPSATIEELASSFKDFLSELSANDPDESDCMSKEIDRRGWEFEFAGQPIFITVFSPLYPEDHVRNAKDTFIFFQLQATFDRHKVGDSVRTTPRVLEIISETKMRFQEQGYQYPTDSVDTVPKSRRYLSPRFHGDSAAEWWKY